MSQVLFESSDPENIILTSLGSPPQNTINLRF